MGSMEPWRPPVLQTFHDQEKIIIEETMLFNEGNKKPSFPHSSSLDRPILSTSRFCHHLREHRR